MKKLFYFVFILLIGLFNAQVKNEPVQKPEKPYVNPVKLTKKERAKPYMDEVLKSRDSLTPQEAERRRKNIELANPFKKYGFYPKIATLSKGKYLEVHDIDSVINIGSVRFNRKTRDIVEFREIDLSDPDAQPYLDTAGRWFSPDPLSEEFPDWSPYNFAFNNPLKFVDPDGRAPEDWIRLGNSVFFDPAVTGNQQAQAKYGENANVVDYVHVSSGNVSTHYSLGQDGSIGTSYSHLPFLNNTTSVYTSNDIKAGSVTIDGFADNANVATIGPIPDSRGKTDIQMLVAENPLVQDAVIGAATGGIFSALRKAAVATTATEGAYSMYYGFDAAGAVKYTGITSRNPALRFAEHAASGGEKAGLFFETQATGLSKTGARVLEQNAINQFGLQKNGGQLLNKINSIAPKKWSQFGVTPP